MADTRTTLPDIFAVMRDPNLTDQEVRLWGIYRSYDHGDGAYPGDETIQAHMASVDEQGRRRPKSLRAIQTYRASLVRKGYLTRELRGPNPAVYRAIVPASRGEESCTPTDAGMQDPAPLQVKNPAPLGQAPQNPAPLGVQASAPLALGVQEGVQEGVQNPALTPTPPIADEYGKYGETAGGEAEIPEPSGAPACSSGDPVNDFLERYPEAAVVLNSLKHPGGAVSTRATLRARFVYRSDEEAMLPEDCVAGLSLEFRWRYVAAALLEMRDQGKAEWSPRVLAGFVRRLRSRPDPEGEHPNMSAAEEEEREQNRRDAARARQVSAEAEARLTLRAQELADDLAEDLRIGRAWLEAQSIETQRQVQAAHLLKLRAGGWRGDQDRAPAALSAPALIAAIRAVRDAADGTVRLVASA